MPPRPARVLIADDQPELRELLSEALTRAGYEVSSADDGQQALDAVRAAAPELVILDLHMPRLDGLQVLAHLKKDPRLQHLPVILLTSRSETRSKVAGLDLGADDYLTKPVELEEFLARVRMVLRRARLGLEANPLTRLPGNTAIQARIEEALAAQAPLAVLYVDLNQFKAFNDVYGYEAGDAVIRRLADILLEAADGDFVGHIGGDDFIVVTTPARARPMADRVIAAFDACAPGFYSEADRARGGIETRDRRGELRRFPLVSVAIGAATNEHRALRSLGQISRIGTELKRYAKTLPGSRCVVDRRTD